MSCGPAFLEAVCQVPGNDTLDYNPVVTDLRQTCDGYDAMDGSRHILVVDDDKELRGLLSRFLTGNGFRVSVAQDAAAMTQTMSAARIDLIILDIMMPGEDGLSICRRLRANGTIPIIMLTAKGSEFDRVARPRNRRRRLPSQAIWHPRAACPRSCRPAARGDARTRIARGRAAGLRVCGLAPGRVATGAAFAGERAGRSPCRGVRRAPRTRRTSATRADARSVARSGAGAGKR